MVAVNNSNQQNNSSHTIRNTAIAAGTGAIASAGTELALQQALLKSPAFKDSYERMTDQVLTNLAQKKTTVYGPNGEVASAPSEKQLAKTNKRIAKIENFRNKVDDLVSSGKMNGKTIAKVGAIGAAVTAGVYLACKGVKNLFTSDKK